jgi:hypothetical protein
MSMIKNWLSGLLQQLDAVAEGRVQHAVRCPECEHSALEASPDCLCSDAGCQCVVLHEEQRG